MKKTLRIAVMLMLSASAALLGSCRYTHDQDVNDTPGATMEPPTVEGRDAGEARDSTDIGGRTPAQSLSSGQTGSDSPNSTGAK